MLLFEQLFKLIALLCFYAKMNQNAILDYYIYHNYHTSWSDMTHGGVYDKIDSGFFHNFSSHFLVN